MMMMIRFFFCGGVVSTNWTNDGGVDIYYKKSFLRIIRQ